MLVSSAKNPAPLLLPAPAAKPEQTQPNETFKPSAKDDFAMFSASKALKDWAEKADVKTIPQMFEAAVAKDPNARYLGHKVNGKFEFISYAQADQQRKELASGLIELGIQPGERVATFADNSPQWVLADLGVITAGGVHAPLYRDSKADAIAFNLKNSKSTTIVVDTEERLAEVLKIAKDLPDLKTIITLKPTEAKSDLNIVSWDELMNQGRESLDKNSSELQKRADEMKATDVASMVFTSGTTGTPKGVLHTHGSLVSSVEGALRIVTDNPTMSLKDVHLKGDLQLSLLPLGHIFERVVAYTLTASGGALAYPEGHKDFMADVAETKPSIIAAVPKLYNKIMEGAQEAADAKPLTDIKKAGPIAAIAAGAIGGLVGGPIGAVVGALAGAATAWKASKHTQGDMLRWALDTSETYHKEKDAGDISFGTRIKHTVAKNLVYKSSAKKIQEKIGENIRILISGGAPLPDRTSVFFLDNGLQLSNGYGTSEIGVTNVNPLGGQRLGTVGPVVSNVELEITPDADFKGHGEIKFRGPNLMLGYLNDPKKTAEAIDSEGFYHTGDIGTTDEAGHVVITGRLKNYIALATGKKIASEPLETKLETCPYISHALVVGESEGYISALVVPNFAKLDELAKTLGISGSSAELAKNPKVIDFLQGLTKELTKDNDSHEQIRKLAIIPRELTEDELAKGEPKRQVLLKTFADLVDGIYKK